MTEINQSENSILRQCKDVEHRMNGEMDRERNQRMKWTVSSESDSMKNEKTESPSDSVKQRAMEYVNRSYRLRFDGQSGVSI